MTSNADVLQLRYDSWSEPPLQSGDGAPEQVSPELVQLVEREVAAWLQSTWGDRQHSLETLTKALLAALRKAPH